MAKRLKGFLAANSILCNNHFGFSQNYSTVLALIDVSDEIYSHLENNEPATFKYRQDLLLGIFTKQICV